MVTLWCIRNITISISVHANSLLWYVYIKYEWQLIVRLGQHGLIDALYTYPCMTSHDVDVIDDAISPSSVRLWSYVTSLRLLGYEVIGYMLKRTLSFTYLFMAYPWKVILENINAHTLLNKNSRKLWENIVHI